MSAFLITQNRGYFLDHKKRSIWLSRKDVSLLAQAGEDARLFLFNKDESRVYGEFVSDVSIAAKSKDGRIAVPLNREDGHRRSAYYSSDGICEEFSLSPLSASAAKRIREKLVIANTAAHPALLSIQLRRNRLAYRYVSLADPVALMEDETPVDETALKSIGEEYEQLIRQAILRGNDLQRMKALGNTLFNLAFKNDGMKTLLAESGKVIYLDIPDSAHAAPWEALCYKNRFIAENALFSFGLRRNSINEDSPAPGMLQAAVVSIPDDSLPHAEKEAEFVYTRLAASRRVSAKRIVSRLSHADFHSILEENDIVHLITHGVAGKSGNGFMLGGRTKIGGESLSSFSNPPLFFFANTCEAGYSPAADTRYAVSALLDAGVRNIIAARGQLLDSVDTAFLSELYDAFLSGEAASIAFRNALLYGKGHAALRYRFFGGHRFRIGAKQ